MTWLPTALAALAVGLLAAILLYQRWHHAETMTALGKINHSVAAVNAAVHLLRGDQESR